METKQEKLFSKNYLLMISVAAFAYTCSFMITSTSPQQCIALGGTKAISGMLASAHTIAAFAFRPTWGRLNDTVGRKKIYYLGIALCLSATAVFFIAKAIPLLFIARIIFGAGFAAVTTSNGTIVADIIPKERFSEGIALYGTASIFSQSVAPGLALFLYDFGFNWVLIAVTLSWLMCLFCGLSVKYNEKEMLKAKAEANSNNLQKKEGGFFEKRAMPAAFTVMFMSLANSSVATFLPLMGIERGIEGVSIYFTLSACGLFCTRVVGRKLPRILGENKVFYGAMCFYLCAFINLIFATSRWQVALAGMCYGFGIGFGFPLLNSAAVRSVESNRRGRATSTYMAMQDVGSSVGSTIWGMVANSNPFTTVYSCVFCVAVCQVISYTLLLRKKAQPGEKTLREILHLDHHHDHGVH